jgi:hypothetical protein
MNYNTPEEAYRAYKNGDRVPYMEPPYEIVGFQGQWGNVDPNYQTYCDQIKESSKRLQVEGKDTLAVYMDLLCESVENSYIASRILQHIALEGKTTKIPLIQTGWNIGVHPNFYIVEGILMREENIWDFYKNNSDRFKRTITKGPFAGYTLDVTWKFVRSIIRLQFTYERSLMITLNKPSQSWGEWLGSFF